MSLPYDENAVGESPRELAELLLALRIPEEVLVALADRNVGVHAAAVDADHRLRQEAGRHPELGRDLAADELVELDLVGGGDDLAVGVVDLELRGCDLGVILLVLKPHRALHFGDHVDEVAQRVAGQRIIVPAGIDVFERVRFVIAALGVEPLKEKAFDLVGGVERVAVLVEAFVGELLEAAANVGGKRRTVLVDDVGENEHLAGAEHVGRRPIERAPVEIEPQIAFALRRESANRRTVEREVVVRAEQETSCRSPACAGGLRGR